VTTPPSGIVAVSVSGVASPNWVKNRRELDVNRKPSFLLPTAMQPTPSARGAATHELVRALSPRRYHRRGAWPPTRRDPARSRQPCQRERARRHKIADFAAGTSLALRLAMSATPKMLVLLWTLTACMTASAPTTSPSKGFPDACTTEVCELGATAHTAHELALLVDFAAPVRVGPYTTGCLTASKDVAVPGAIALASSDVAVPAACTGDCRPKVMFRLIGAPAGVTCLSPEAGYDQPLCAGLAIAGARVRLRPVLQDIHPSALGNWAPIVDVLGGCEAACAPGELACPATQTCWATARDHCAYCLGGDNQQCACWEASGAAQDGATCAYFVSGDVEQPGTCRAGRCVAAPR
jgi:hypothetical protein